MIYNLCKRLIAMGKTAGLAEKVDVYYLAGRLTTEQYKELMEELGHAE